MKRDPQILAGLAAVAAGLAGVLQLLEGDYLRGATGLAIAGIFGVIAADMPRNSPAAAKVLGYGLLIAAFALLGIRMFMK